MLSCIMFRRNHNEYKKNNETVKETVKETIKETDEKSTYTSEKVDEISACEPITCEPVIEENLDNKESYILNMVNKEYMRLEKIRLEKDKLIYLQDTCENDHNDIIYYRNLYNMEEDKINKQILELLQYLK